MKEKIFTIEEISPARFFGPDQSMMNNLSDLFPGLMISSRGNQIKVKGSEDQLKIFEEKLGAMINFLHHHDELTRSDLEDLINEESKSNYTATNKKDEVLVYGPNNKVVRARTPNQKKMVEANKENDILFALGPAGTGKTYTAVAMAVRALKNKEIKKIILARPAVEAGESLGFLPGDLKEKIDPYLRPLYDSLLDMIPGEKYQQYLESGTIEIAPMAFMRGRTLNNCFVLLDEAQNATDVQLKMFLTRMGPNAKIIITGDLTQIDLPKHQTSGLMRAIKILKNIKGISIVELDVIDVVRHKLVKEIIKAYDKAE